MYGLLLQIATGIVGIYLASEFIDGFTFTGSIMELAAAGSLLGLLNFFLKPLLKIVFFPLRLLTFGLFTFVINIAILWGVDVYLETISIQGIMPLVWGTIFISIVSMILGWFLKPKKKTLSVS